MLNQGNRQGQDQVPRNLGVRTQTWKEMCATLNMTLQCSPFLRDDQGMGVEIQRPLQRRQTLYPKYVMPGARMKVAPRHQEEGHHLGLSNQDNAPPVAEWSSRTRIHGELGNDGWWRGCSFGLRVSLSKHWKMGFVLLWALWEKGGVAGTSC